MQRERSYSDPSVSHLIRDLLRFLDKDRLLLTAEFISTEVAGEISNAGLEDADIVGCLGFAEVDV